MPFGKGGVTADLGQSRGAQGRRGGRHAVWLAANNLEPKLSPFDPLAVLDEIARLVPGYALDRINLFGGNDVPTEPGFVPVSCAVPQTDSGTDCSRARRTVHLRHAGPLQPRAQGTRAASGARIGRNRGRLAGF